MADGTYPGAPVGFNARLSVSGYGRRYVRITRLSYGLRIITTQEEAASRRTVYPLVTTGSSFRASVEWRSVQERDSFNSWMRAYMTRVSSNDDSIDGWMSIECPVRKFFRTAVPEGTLDYGDTVPQVKFSTELSFVGARSPNDPDAGARRAGLSYLVLPKDPVAAYFYPTGHQIKGEASDSPFDGPRPTPRELTGDLPTDPNGPENPGR